MNTFSWNGVDVATSFLTQRAHRAVYCEFLVNVTRTNQAKALAAFKKGKKFSGLRVSGLADLSFLADFPNLLYLEVVDQDRVNTRPLDGLDNLRGLRLETPGSGVDFARFPLLEVFVGDWHPDNANLHRCAELRQLRIRHFKPKSLDLSEIANTTRLEWLELTQTGITSLAGLETLEDLRYLKVAFAPKLESLDFPASDRHEIRELSLERANKIESYEPLGALRRLRRLKLTSCAPMPDLKWTQGLDHLDFFSFVETNVVDGDLSPLLKLPKLRYVGTMDKRHYNYKFDALNRRLAEQR